MGGPACDNRCGRRYFLGLPIGGERCRPTTMTTARRRRSCTRSGRIWRCSRSGTRGAHRAVERGNRPPAGARSQANRAHATWPTSSSRNRERTSEHSCRVCRGGSCRAGTRRGARATCRFIAKFKALLSFLDHYSVSIFWTLSGSCPLCLTPPCLDFEPPAMAAPFFNDASTEGRDARGVAVFCPTFSLRAPPSRIPTLPQANLCHTIIPRKLYPSLFSLALDSGSLPAPWFRSRQGLAQN